MSAFSWSPLHTPSRGGAHTGGGGTFIGGMSSSTHTYTNNNNNNNNTNNNTNTYTNNNNRAESPRRRPRTPRANAVSSAKKRFKVTSSPDYSNMSIDTSGSGDVRKSSNVNSPPSKSYSPSSSSFSLTSPKKSPLRNTGSGGSGNRYQYHHHHLLSPDVENRSSPSTSSNVSCRFIPTRGDLDGDMDIVRHIINKDFNVNGKENGSASSSSSSSSDGNSGSRSGEGEFNRRLRGVLLNVDDSSDFNDNDHDRRNGNAKDSTLDDDTPTKSNVSRLVKILQFSKKNGYGCGSLNNRKSNVIDPRAHDDIRVLFKGSKYDSSYAPNSNFNFSLNSSSKNNSIGRFIPSAPTRILDAPELVDDYYLNLISWGVDNILAVALGQCVYLWNASTGSIDHLLTLSGQDDYVTSVSWSSGVGCTHYLAVGTNNSTVQLWDVKDMKIVRTMDGHNARVGALAWNKNWLSSGGRDSIIIQHDVRSAQHRAATYVGHKQEVCGLKWNEDGTTLASGGNENYLCLWDANMSERNHNRNHNRAALNEHANDDNGAAGYKPRLTLNQHTAAVKALAWCPFQRNLLASGGGTADRTIKFWNTNSGDVVNSIDTGSQVCSLLWSKGNKEICSSHGFSENQLILWSYPSMSKIQEFKGHTARVLHMDSSPDGSTVVSAAADETLRFWDVFGKTSDKSGGYKKSGGSVLGSGCVMGGVGRSMGGIR